MYLHLWTVNQPPVVDLAGNNTNLNATVKINFYAEKQKESFLSEDETEWELAFDMETEIGAELDFAVDKNLILKSNIADFHLAVTHLNVHAEGMKEISRKDVDKVLKAIKNFVRPMLNQLLE